MAVAMLRSSIFLLLSTAALAGEVCLDGMCARSVESNAGGKTSLLQQNAVRSAPANFAEVAERARSSPANFEEMAAEAAELSDDEKLKAKHLDAFLEEEDLKLVAASRSKAAQRLTDSKLKADATETKQIEEEQNTGEVLKEVQEDFAEKLDAKREASAAGSKLFAVKVDAKEATPEEGQTETIEAPKKAQDFAEKLDAKKEVAASTSDAKKEAAASTSDAKKEAAASTSDAKKDAAAPKSDAKKEAAASKADAKRLANKAAAATLTSEKAAEKEAEEAAAKLEAAVAAAGQEASEIAAAAVAAAEDVTGSQAEQEENDAPVTSALVDRTHKLVMGWTPRAACTAAVYMFFQSAGMYTPEDQQRFPWIHDYREALDEWAQPRESDMNNKEFLKFKVVRNPYTRAISNWVHQMGTNFSFSPERQALAAKHGVSDQSNFLEWLAFVQKVDWHELDQHSWPQFSRWENGGGRYDMVLQLEDPLFQTHLDQINGAYNSTLFFQTMHVSLAQGTNNSQPVSHTPRTARHPPFASELFTHAKSSKTPKPEDIYKKYPAAIDFVQWVYFDDFNAYGYDRDVTKTYGYQP